MTFLELMIKAERACASARLLLESGDLEGACNRAYYAMFDAARAALTSAGAPVGFEAMRTHGGLISAFSLHLVKTGRLPVELGRALNRAQELRLIADYRGEPIDSDQVEAMVQLAEQFVQTINVEFASRSGDDHTSGKYGSFA